MIMKKKVFDKYVDFLGDDIFNDILPFEYDSDKSKGGLSWDVSEMMIHKFKQKIQMIPSFIRMFNPAYNMTKAFKKEVKFRTSAERNIIIEISGLTGSGKSILAMTLILKWMNKKLTIEDICFTIDLLLKRASDVKKNHALIQDEQKYSVGVGSQREQYERQNLEDTTRKFGLSMIFCSPTIQGHSTAHYSLEIICLNREKRLTKVAILNLSGGYLGYFVIPVIAEEYKLWIEYNKRKDIFISGVLARDIQRLSLDDMSRSLTKDKMWNYCKTRQDMKIVATKKYPTLTSEEINMIVDNYRLLKRMKGGD